MFLGDCLAKEVCLTASGMSEEDRKTTRRSAIFLCVAGNIDIGQLKNRVAIKHFDAFFLGSKLWPTVTGFSETAVLLANFLRLLKLRFRAFFSENFSSVRDIRVDSDAYHLEFC